MIHTKTVTGIILSAGNSTRFGKNRNKNFELINGKSVLSYSLNAFKNNDYIDNIIVVIKEENREIVQKIINEQKINKKTDIVSGGKSRKESVYNAIKKVTSDIAIIQDAARPAIKQKYINDCVEQINNFKGVTIGVKSKDTIKITDENNVVVDTTNRNNTWIIQTPQCFDRKVLLKMHEEYKDECVTDDCTLLEKGNYKVKILEGDYTNIKITTYDDFCILEKILTVSDI